VVSDEFWRRVEPLIPQQERPSDKLFARKPGAGIAFRKVPLSVNIIYG
jgi:hypothetical protein